jgi:hypothetical protein
MSLLYKNNDSNESFFYYLVRVERERLAVLGFPMGRRLGNINASISVSLGSYHRRTTFASLNGKQLKNTLTGIF